MLLLLQQHAAAAAARAAAASAVAYHLELSFLGSSIVTPEAVTLAN